MEDKKARFVRDILLKLLAEDDEVIQAVKRINTSEHINFESNENQDSELLQQISELQRKISAITQEKDYLGRELNRQKEQEISALREEHALALQKKDADIGLLERKYMECKTRAGEAVQAKEEAVGECDYYKQKYSGLDAVYRKYLELGAPIIQKMERILNQSSEVTEAPDIFMAYGSQENNIVALWDSIAANFDFYDSQGKTEDLIDIFQYFLKLYKEISYKNIQIKWPDTGDSYDEREHTRTSSSSAVGKIQKVILPGFSIGKSITKKALVIVK